jgi:hypothetical protein
MRVVLLTGAIVAQVAAAPFADTALTMLHVLERDRVAQLRAEAEELRLVERIAFAFHAPKELDGIRRAFLDRAGLLPTADEAVDAGARLFAAVEKLGWVPNTALAEEA